MAGKTTQGSRTGRARKAPGKSKNRSTPTLKTIDFRNFNKGDAKKIINKVSNNPLALYIAGGVGAIFATRFALRYYKNHPELKDFIKENFDAVESTLKEYRHGIEESEGGEARH